MPSRILVDRNVAVPMRDATLLTADVYRPESGAPVPAIVSRLPYNKDVLSMQAHAIHPMRAAEAGFAVVYQDTRGRYSSEGDFYPFVHEGSDGFDTVEWVAAQAWCDGSVGMTGASYFGATQWLAAVERPPHLRAICPIVTASEYYEGWTYQGGAYQLGFALLWTLASLAPNLALRLAGQEELTRTLDKVDRIGELYSHLPLKALPVLRDHRAASYYFDWLAHEANDEYWCSLAINRRYREIQVPALNVGGWYDLFLHGTLENYVRMRKEGGTAAARGGQRLLVGPWSHGDLTGEYPGYSYGSRASVDIVDLTALQLSFFEHHLRGSDNGLEARAPVRIFVMGENRWRDEWEWPLARTQYERWYLHSEAGGTGHGGYLSREAPDTEPSDAYLYDPRDPAPSVGGPTFLPGLGLGANSGPRDQRQVESRPDVLTYSSAPLQRAVEVTGPLSVVLYAATSAQDTDFVARLCDVAPDGCSRILAEGILRARYRNGCEQAEPVESGRAYAYQINLVATANLFLEGHRIRVDITSSSFPRFDRNTNTGNPLGQDAARDLRPAMQTILHDQEHPSHILLPIVPRT